MTERVIGIVKSFLLVLNMYVDQTPVVQTMDCTIRWMNHYSVDNSIHFASVYLLVSDSSGW